MTADQTISLTQSIDFGQPVTAGPVLAAGDFQSRSAKATIAVGDQQFSLADYLALIGYALDTSETQEQRDNWMLQAGQTTRGLYMLHECDMLVQSGQDPVWAESVTRRAYDQLPIQEYCRNGGSPVSFSVTAERLVVDTASRAVHFNDENFLALAQERCFMLGTNPRHRYALAEFLQPYDVDRPEAGVKVAEARRRAAFEANSPLLYTRTSVLEKVEIRHRTKSLRANGKAVLALESGDGADGPSGYDRTVSPWLPSLVDGRSNCRSNFLAAELCYELSEQEWCEITLQLDQRTAEELKAWRDGKLIDTGKKNYQHFWRQMHGPSKLAWLIMAHRKNGGGHEDYCARSNRNSERAAAGWGAPTSFFVPGIGWQHAPIAGAWDMPPVVDYSGWLTTEQVSSRFEVNHKSLGQLADEGRVRRTFWDVPGTLDRVPIFNPDDVHEIFSKKGVKKVDFEAL